MKVLYTALRDKELIDEMDIVDIQELYGKKLMELKLLDLFSGIGGFSYAAEKIVGGYETTQFVEIDPYCQSVLRKNFPNTPIHDDIKTFSAKPRTIRRFHNWISLPRFIRRRKTKRHRMNEQDQDYSTKVSGYLKFDLDSPYLKTLEIYSLTKRGRPSKKSSFKLPKQGMMLNGQLFQQKIWEPVILESDSGSLPTPTAEITVNDGQISIVEDESQNSENTVRQNKYLFIKKTKREKRQQGRETERCNKFDINTGNSSNEKFFEHKKENGKQ